MRLDSQPIDDASCQNATRPTGKNQGARRNNHLFFVVAISRSLALCDFARDEFIRNRFALLLQALWLRNFWYRDIQMREQ